jgi:prepilin-type N-terminal cleavage/methylation domain-containing protein
MKLSSIRKAGFTLVEIMIVVAIIGHTAGNIQTAPYCNIGGTAGSGGITNHVLN